MKDVTLLPLDIYQVVNKSLLNENDKLVLTMLYMPIIGSSSVALYNALYSELTASGYVSKELTHKHLMSSLGETLENIKKSRKKLEAIGLMKTYFMEGSVNSYVYELYSPLTVHEFFTNPIFNTTFLSSVGLEEYTRIKNYFKVPKLELNGYKDITSEFDMTFKSGNFDNYDNSDNNDLAKKIKLPLSYEIEFDFDTLLSSMPKGLFNKNALTKSVKEFITHLAFLYNMDPFTMADMVSVSLNEKGLIDKEELKKNTRKYYEYNNHGKLPSLLYKSQPENLRSVSTKNAYMDRMIKVFETTNPVDFLKSKYKGVKPTGKDMQILEMLIVDLKFNPAVCNVLIDYILKTQNNRLVKSYIEVVAGEWKRANLETAKEAMKYAEKAHKNIKKKQNEKVTQKRTEKVPEWFGTKKEKQEMNSEEEQELKEFLKEFV